MSDVEIKLGARTYNLRPTFGAMREIEAQCKSSCATLLQLLARHEMHSSEMALVVYFGMVEAGESKIDMEAVGKRLFEAGIGTEAVRKPVAEYLTELLYAPDDARKKAAGEWFAESEAITSLMFELPQKQSESGSMNSTEPLPENSGQSSKRRVKRPSK